MIVGENGAGKSTILDALCFALYGKPFRKINKPALINSINQKDLKVELEFEIGTIEYKIIRGIAPNIFEIWRNGTMMDQSSSVADYQNNLETNILKMNFKSFGQIVILGSSTFVPFMQLAAASRREIIEDLLDLQVFSVMQSLLKENIAETRDELVTAENRRVNANNQLQAAIKHNRSIKQMKGAEIDKLKLNAKKHLDSIRELKSVIEKRSEQVDDLLDSPKIAKKAKILDSINDIKSQILTFSNSKDEHWNQKVFFTENDTCPTCSQDISDKFKQDEIDLHDATIVDLSDMLIGLEAKLKQLVKALDMIKDVENEASELSVKNKEDRAIITAHNNTLKSIKKEMLDAENEMSAISDDEILGYEKDVKQWDTALIRLHEDAEVQKIAQTVLKDGGIKSQIVKQYIPVMNKWINAYLAKLDFFVNFELDETFKETIKSRHRDEFTYMSFSEGEKARIDLALMLTWRTIAKLRNSTTTNLLILDEVFDGSLDTDGSANLIEILSGVIEDNNVFVISHKGDALHDKFDKHLKFKKVKNFSMMT